MASESDYLIEKLHTVILVQPDMRTYFASSGQEDIFIQNNEGAFCNSLKLTFHDTIWTTLGPN